MNDTAESGLAISSHRNDAARCRHQPKNETHMTEDAHVGDGDGDARSWIEFIGERAPEQGTPTSAHLGIDVSDIRRLCSILEQAGVTFRRPRTPNSRPGARNLTAHMLDPAIISNPSSDITIEPCFLDIETAFLR
jgi:hypothetical protein